MSAAGWAALGLWAATFLYIGVALAFAIEGRGWWALTYIGYSAANIGLIAASQA